MKNYILNGMNTSLKYESRDKVWN